MEEDRNAEYEASGGEESEERENEAEEDADGEADDETLQPMRRSTRVSHAPKKLSYDKLGGVPVLVEMKR